MPKYVGKELLFTSFLLETKNDKLKGSGTCFVFDYEFEGKDFPFLVTNRHVVEGMKIGRITFTKSKNDEPDIGNGFDVILTDFPKFWHYHPDNTIDVAVTPFMPIVTQCQNLGNIPFYTSIPHTIIPTESKSNELDAIEDIIFIGYPKGLRDEKNLIPIIRKGITATPINLDYDGKKQFLIDASVFPGSSGSPVFLYERELVRTEKEIVNTKKMYFLGILSRGFLEKQKNKVEEEVLKEEKSFFSQHEQMLDLGVVYKAEIIMETIKSLLEKRKNTVGSDKM